MEVKINAGKVSLASISKLVALGYWIGTNIIFVPVFTLMTVMGAPITVNGQTIVAPTLVLGMVMIVTVPVILALQGVLIGWLVTLGLAVYGMWRPIRIAKASS